MLFHRHALGDGILFLTLQLTSASSLNHQNILASRLFFSIRPERLPDCRLFDCLMLLGQLSRQRDIPVSQRAEQLLECPDKPVRRLVQHDGSRLRLQLLQNLRPFFFVHRKKGLKAEPPCRFAGADKRIHRRAGSRDRRNSNPILKCHADQIFPGVGNARCPCVRHDSNILPLEQTVDQDMCLAQLVVFMVARHRGMDVKMIQQLDTSPCILRCNQIDLSERSNRPWRHIFQVSDRRRDQIQYSRHLSLTLTYTVVRQAVPAHPVNTGFRAVIRTAPAPPPCRRPAARR